MNFVLELKKTIVVSIEAPTLADAVEQAEHDDQADWSALWYRAEPEVAVLEGHAPAPEYPLTAQQYVQKMGLHCPVCGSADVEGEPLQTDDGRAWACVECKSCHAMWDDQYTLTGYGNLTPFDPPKTDVRDLSAQELADKYAGPNGAWGEHPDFCRKDWQTEVGNDDTLLGYWDWVVAQLDQQDARS